MAMNINNLHRQTNGIDKKDELADRCCDQSPHESGSKQTACTEISEDIINWDKLIERLVDEETIKEVVPIFLKDNTERLGVLTEMVKANNAEQIRCYAHGITGAGRNVGARRLSDIPYQLECAGKENDMEAFASLFEDVKSELETVMSFLSRDDWIELAKRERVITDEKLDAYIAC